MHLIHIGYPKAGSHFVQRWFSEHPQLEYLEGGFAGFRDVRDFARQCASGSDVLYRVTSAEEFSSPHALVGRISADGHGTCPSAQTAACEMLASLFRDPYILLLTRGFKSGLLSGYSEYVRSGGDRDFFALRPATEADMQMANNAWNYNHLVGIYRERFGERLIVLPYEMLRDSPKDFVSQLEKRLGLDPADVSLSRVYPSLSPIELRWYPRISRAVRRLPVGQSLKRRVFEHYVRSIWSNRWRAPIKALERLFPSTSVSADLIPVEAVEYFRGRADCLKSEPAYAAYAEDYLF